MPSTILDLTSQNKRGKSFCLSKIQFTICKVMVVTVESEFILMFPEMYSRIWLMFYQKNKKKKIFSAAKHIWQHGIKQN